MSIGSSCLTTLPQQGEITKINLRVELVTESVILGKIMYKNGQKKISGLEF